MKKSNVVKEYVVSCSNGINLLMHLVRKGNFLVPTVVKVVDNNEQENQKEKDHVKKET